MEKIQIEVISQGRWNWKGRKVQENHIEEFNVLLSNGKKVSNFYEMKNEIQIYIAQYVREYFNLPTNIENDVCYMNNLTAEDNKLNFSLSKTQWSIL